MKLICTLGLAFLLVTLGTACSPFEELSAHRKFVEAKVIPSPDIRYYLQNSDTGAVAHARAGTPIDAIVVWLHGTPGRWTDIGRVMVDPAATERVLWVSVDRAGWGGSRPALPSSVSVSTSHQLNYASFTQQVAPLIPLVDQLATQYPTIPIYAAGHSWGASLAPALALANQNIDGLLLFAGGLSPELMEIRWYHRLANTKLAELVLGDAMLRATEEMIALPSNLKALSAGIEKSSNLRDMPIYVIQGGKDSLVDADNATYWQETSKTAKDMRGLEVFIDPDFGHLWHMQRSAAIKICIDAIVNTKPDVCKKAVDGR